PPIKSVSIAAAPTATNQPADPPPRAPTVAAVAKKPANPKPEPTMTIVIQELESAVTKQPNDLEKQLRLRMLYAVLGLEDKALAPTPGMNGDAIEMVRGLVKPMLEVCRESNRDPAACATRQLAAVEELRSFLRTRADL